MSNFVVCFNAVLPLIIYVAVGMTVRKAGLMNGAEIKRFNRMLFAAFFPVLMFDNIYDADIKSAFDPRLMLFAAAFIIVSAFVSCLAVTKITKDPHKRGAMAQAIYRSNYVLMGLVITENIFGKDGLSVTTALITVVVPLFNVTAVIVLETFRGGTVSVKHMIKNVVTNPLILGAFAGIAACLCGLALPGSLESVISGMAACVTPVALVLLGASFDFSRIAAMKSEIAICVIGRLLVWPAIGLPAAYLLGFRGPAFVSLLVVIAASTSVSSFTMAEAMDSDGELAGSAVMFSTLFSCVTLFLWLYLFRCLGAY